MSDWLEVDDDAAEEERFQQIAKDVMGRQRTRIRYRHAKETLARVIASRGLAQQRTDEQLQTAWNEAAGERLAKKTRVGLIRRGTLEVMVSHSVVAQELGFMKPVLLKKLRTLLSDARVRDLRFRVGPLD